MYVGVIIFLSVGILLWAGWIHTHATLEPFTETQLELRRNALLTRLYQQHRRLSAFVQNPQTCTERLQAPERAILKTQQRWENTNAIRGTATDEELVITERLNLLCRAIALLECPTHEPSQALYDSIQAGLVDPHTLANGVDFTSCTAEPSPTEFDISRAQRFLNRPLYVSMATTAEFQHIVETELAYFVAETKTLADIGTWLDAPNASEFVRRHNARRLPTNLFRQLLLRFIRAEVLQSRARLCNQRVAGVADVGTDANSQTQTFMYMFLAEPWASPRDFLRAVRKEWSKFQTCNHVILSVFKKYEDTWAKFLSIE